MCVCVCLCVCVSAFLHVPVLCVCKNAVLFLCSFFLGRTHMSFLLPDSATWHESILARLTRSCALPRCLETNILAYAQPTDDEKLEMFFSAQHEHTIHVLIELIDSDTETQPWLKDFTGAKLLGTLRRCARDQFELCAPCLYPPHIPYHGWLTLQSLTALLITRPPFTLTPVFETREPRRMLDVRVTAILCAHILKLLQD